MDETESQQKKGETQNFMENMDLHGLVHIFDSYATKKTFATSFFNLALIATNFTQLKHLISISQTGELGTLNTVILLCVIISLVLQVVVGAVLVFLAKNREFIDDEKRDQLIRSNNTVTLLIVTVSILNVFINVFLNV